MQPSRAPISSKPSRKQGGFATLIDQRAIIEAVLSVANLKPAPTDPDAIYGPLDPFAAGGCARLKESGAEAAAILWRDFSGHRSHSGLWRHGAIAALDAIARNVKTARREFGPLVDEALLTSRAELVAVPRLDAGRIVAPLQVRGYGAQAVIAFCLALLLDGTALADKSRSYGQALRRCALPTCGKFFLSTTGAAGGRPQAYHEAQCRIAHAKILRALRS
jgi:hypothetical protein